MLGNFIADHVKGSAVENYTGEIREGIRIHRLIDSFTDSHPVVEESKARLRPEFRKYAPVIVDIFYDHFLARDWLLYHPHSLEQFAADTYLLLQTHDYLRPVRTRHMLKYMIQQNWLLNYATLQGMQKALIGLSQRTSFESNMQYAHLSLEKNYIEFENEFNRFFPELIKYVKGLSSGN